MAALQETGRKQVSELIKGTTKFESESGVNFYFGTVDVKGSTTIDPIGTVLQWDGTDAFGILAAPADWAATTAYVVGDVVKPAVRDGFEYIVTDAGTSGASEPTFVETDGAVTVDATVIWQARYPYGTIVGSPLPNNASACVTVGAKEGIGFNKAGILLSATAIKFTVIFRGPAQLANDGMEFGSVDAADIAEFKVALEKQGLSVVGSATNVVPSFIVA